jgi:hypothetical protein
MIYYYKRTVNFDKLHRELKTQCPHYDFLNTEKNYLTGDMSIEVHTTQTLTPEENSVLDSIIINHDILDQEQIVKQKVQKAMIGANIIIEQFATENILMGITQAGKTKLIADTLRDVFYYFQTGSLYESLNAIDSLVLTQEMEPFLTQERRAKLRQNIVDLINSL